MVITTTTKKYKLKTNPVFLNPNNVERYKLK
jgi:hypothetical protein